MHGSPCLELLSLCALDPENLVNLQVQPQEVWGGGDEILHFQRAC